MTAVSRLCTAFLVAGLLAPAPLFAATIERARTLVVSAAPEGNMYLAGTDITVAAALPHDVLAAGGTITIAAPIAEDALLAGGTVRVEQSINGDARIAGGRVSVLAPVAGDLLVAGETVHIASTAKDTRVFGGTVRVAGGNDVSILGATVELSGTFEGDVRVVASDRLTLADDTVITGTLSYDAPQQITVPASAKVPDIAYTGSSSFLPTAEQAQTFALAGAGIFFLVRIFSVLIAAALLAGLFPFFTQRVADFALAQTPGRFPLTILLGFGVFIATPVLLFILFLSFVGSSAAIVLLLAYLLLAVMSYLFAGILAGAALGRALFKRKVVSWRIALLGMLVFFLVGTVPAVGGIVTLLLFLAALGAIVSITFQFAFSRFLPTKDSAALDA